MTRRRHQERLDFLLAKELERSQTTAQVPACVLMREAVLTISLQELHSLLALGLAQSDVDLLNGQMNQLLLVLSELYFSHYGFTNQPPQLFWLIKLVLSICIHDSSNECRMIPILKQELRFFLRHVDDLDDRNSLSATILCP